MTEEKEAIRVARLWLSSELEETDEAAEDLRHAVEVLADFAHATIVADKIGSQMGLVRSAFERLENRIHTLERWREGILDRFVADWHEGEPRDVSLAEYLGMSDTEYERWVEARASAPKEAK